MNLNLSPTLSMEQVKDEDHDHHYEGFKFGLNHQIFSSSSSSSSSPCRILFSSRQDHGGLIMEDYYGYDGGSAYGIENKVEKGLRLGPAESMLVKDSHVKWVPTQIEVKKVKVSCCLETDLSSSSYNCNTPIRVCSDCHTTKTPLWRSGPKGPKSLCNACGIRQRKARRAMAAAAAACGRTGVDSYQPTPAKVKEKMGKSGKKRCKPGAGSGVGSSSSSGFEDFLINLSNKLSFHRVFPQDEKEAAILLMALSSGLVHG